MGFFVNTCPHRVGAPVHQSLRRALLACLLSLCGKGAVLTAADYDYAQALQVGLTFLEVNEAGKLSPLNRLQWRGDSFLEDGSDVGVDLNGGWMDAGDHLKANNTMAPAASTLAWSVLTFPEVYQQKGQMPYALNSLRFISDYFDRCIVDGKPQSPDDYSDYRVYVNIGSQVYDPSNLDVNIAPSPQVHTVWCPPEVVNGYTARQTLRIDASNPNTPEAGHMSSALAAAAVVLHRYGTASDKARAEKYYSAAAKLSRFARTHFAYDGTALQPDGKRVVGQYMNYDARLETATTIAMWSELWLQKLAEELSLVQGSVTHRDQADTLLSNYLATGKYLWQIAASWVFTGYNHHVFMLRLQMDGLSAATRTAYENAVLGLVDKYAKGEPDATFTPGGLSRKNNHYVFLLHHVVRTCALAAMYAHYTSDATLRDRLRTYVTNQVNYILGANPVAKSFLIGYGNYGNIYHHRGAHGTWDGNQYWNGETYYLPRMRHIAYGALLGGPNDKDEYTVDDTLDFLNHFQCEPVISQVGHVQIATAYLTNLNLSSYTPIADFPPPETRTLSDDPEWTDHEIYVAAKVQKQASDSLELDTSIYNRSGWPPRILRDASYRYYFTADAGETQGNQFTLTVTSSDGGVAGEVVHVVDDQFYAEVRFPGVVLMPNRLDNVRYWRRAATLRIVAASGTFDASNDFSQITETSARKVAVQLPVYEGATLFGGTTPFSVQRRVLQIRIHDRAVDTYTVIAEPDTATVEALAGPQVYRVISEPHTSVTLSLGPMTIGLGTRE